jgi:coproporphyrinogen III oxidase
MTPAAEAVESWMRQLQDEICRSLEALDGQGRFREDRWQRLEGGGGITRVMTNAPGEGVFEKGGVNFSAVAGPVPGFLKEEVIRSFPDTDPEQLKRFYATGVSLVLHPRSPWVPIAHMNVRYFRIRDDVQWFGGGIDLTPVYVDEAEARHFHRALQEACDRHHPGYYEEFRRWADDYFYLPHRGETRGIGGIFFDRLGADATFSIEDRFRFVREIGALFAPLYATIVSRKKDLPYTEPQRAWQALRRARYAEFNLVYDRGTRFGLETGGRTESILMSLPPVARWDYNVQPEKGSPEEKTTTFLKKGMRWAEELPE